VTLFFLAMTLVAEARSGASRVSLPLMPAREPEVPLTLEELSVEPIKEPSETLPRGKFAFLKDEEQSQPRSRAPSYARVMSGPYHTRSGPATLLGFELGTLGRSTSTSPDALGLKLMWGGRAFLVLPVAKRVFLKPSLGFFYRRESAAKVAISEHMGEAGLNVQYAFSQDRGINWMAGLVSRFEVSFSKTSISALTASAAPTSTSSSSAALLRYRLGPSLGLTYKVTPDIGLLIDTEVTFSFSSPVKPYAGFVSGLIFKL
jgi:hypothetical protein